MVDGVEEKNKDNGEIFYTGMEPQLSFIYPKKLLRGLILIISIILILELINPVLDNFDRAMFFICLIIFLLMELSRGGSWVTVTEDSIHFHDESIFKSLSSDEIPLIAIDNIEITTIGQQNPKLNILTDISRIIKPGSNHPLTRYREDEFNKTEIVNIKIKPNHQQGKLGFIQKSILKNTVTFPILDAERFVKIVNEKTSQLNPKSSP